MDPSRSQRFGKPYYRSYFMPPNTRQLQTLEDRLHPPGISTSSNSSWTFSNSHCDIPKPRKGRLCGIFLIGAVLVVALAVIAIAGLAFYIGGYTTERHHVSEYQTKDHIGAKGQYSTTPTETTQKSTSRSPSKSPNSDSPPLLSTPSKATPAGPVFAISDTMQQLNGLKNKRKEDAATTTTDTPEDSSTEFSLVDANHSDSFTDVELVPEKEADPSGGVQVFEEPDRLDAPPEYEVVKNGHARPSFAAATTTTTPTTTSPVNFPPRRDYSDEPWRPIVPSYRDTLRIKSPYKENQERVVDHRYGPLIEPMIENDGPITFSRESYEQNLKITPEFTGSGDKFDFHNNHNSRISDDTAVKYKDFIDGHRKGTEGVAEIVVTSGEILTAPPPKPADVIIVAQLPTTSTLTTSFNATQDTNVSERLRKPPYPIGVDQMLTSISVVETNLKALQNTPTPTPTTKGPTTRATVKEDTPTTPPTPAPKTKTTAAATPPSPALAPKANTTPGTSPTTATTELILTTPRDSNLTTPLQADSAGPDVTVKNPFLDDSRASSSGFNFGLPELPILKQFHHLDSLLKSFSSEPEAGNQLSKYFVRTGNDGNETTVTRFPARTKQTTVKNYKSDDAVTVEVSTRSAQPTAKSTPATRKAVVVRGEVEVVPGPVKQERLSPTTEMPKLITLLPVRSNVNMMRPLRPRPKSNINGSMTVTRRKSKMAPEFRLPNRRTSELLKFYSAPRREHEFVHDQNGKRWIYYSSSSNQGATPKNEKLFIVTPEPKPNQTEGDTRNGFLENLANLPLYNTIETLLNSDYRNKHADADKPAKNTSDIVDKIVRIVENVAISTGDSPKVIVKVNQTLVNRTTTHSEAESSDKSNDKEMGMSTKAISSHYKLNQAGVPVLTKVLNKAHASEKLRTDDVSPTDPHHVTECGSESVKCGNGTCLPPSKKCDQFIDCPDAADEKNCSCAEHLRAQKLDRKLCDGVVDCWDFSDEFNCEWCQEEFLCSNSRTCVRKEQICDGTNDCPFGDDERNCVTVSPSRTEAETFNYHHNGYLMVRKNGRWGKLCIDNFESVSLKSRTGWKISDLGRTVCKALTFRDFDKVEKMISVPNEGRSVGGADAEKYFELAYNEVSNSHHARNSLLSFHETDCTKKEVVKVTCTDLECGLRPQATNQWSSRRSRIVGGGNAGPGAWPWQAALYKEGEFQCGATLVSENWLISAGHCFYHNQDAYWVARLGTLRTTLLLPSPYEQLRQISKIILHPQYVDSGFINDISLLRMRDAVRFTDYVRPICLPKPEAAVIDGTMCTVVGWGQLSEVGWVFPDTLQEVQLPILSSNECRKKTLFLPLYKITDDMFCAGYERGGRDACLGDSGGPLMCQEPDGKWSLFGVTSNGYGCGRSNRPGVYTKVSKYLQWIQSQMALHSESLTPGGDSDDRINPSTSRNFTHAGSAPDHVVASLSQRLSGKSRDKCKGHRCPLGECLAKSKLCNGHIECSDGSDEKDCW